MTEEEWLACARPEQMFRPMPGGGPARKRRLFAVACCRLVFDWLVDNRSREAVNVAEGFADGAVDFHQLERAYDQAFRALGIVGGEPARAATRVALEHLTDANLSDLVALIARSFGTPDGDEWCGAREFQAVLLRDIFGNPFRPVTFSPDWRRDTAVSLARTMYESRDFSAMPVLADALQDAGCDNDDVLDHSRTPGAHVRGCWVVDSVLGKE